MHVTFSTLHVIILTCHVTPFRFHVMPIYISRDDLHLYNKMLLNDSPVCLRLNSIHERGALCVDSSAALFRCSSDSRMSESDCEIPLMSF